FAASNVFDPGEVGAGRLSDEEAGAGEALAHDVRLVHGDRDTLIDHLLVQDRRYDVLGAAERLQSLHAGERLGLDADDANAWVMLLQAPPQTGDRAARAHAGDDVAEPTPGLLE